MKRKTARELFVDSFHELAQTRSFDRITVREIAEKCGYFTATFYRNFMDKYDLIVWDYARGIEQLMSRIGINGYTWRQALVDYLRIVQENRGYLANILRHTSGHDSFIHYMTDIHCKEAMNHIRKSAGTTPLDPKIEMYVRLYCMGSVSLSAEWILGQTEVSPEEFAEVCAQSLPPPMRPWLLGNETI